MNKNSNKKITAAVMLLALAACSPSEQGSEESVPVAVASLEDSNWHLLQLTVSGGFVFTPDDPGKYVLNFRSENRLTGSSDCNQITGSWLQEASSLRFEPFLTTRSLCPPGSLHNNLALNLRDVVSHEIRDGKLILGTTIDGVEMEFERRE